MDSAGVICKKKCCEREEHVPGQGLKGEEKGKGTKCRRRVQVYTKQAET